MSLESWKEEFYPVNASKTEAGIPAIEHSLRKWIGLRKENLQKHGGKPNKSYGDLIVFGAGSGFRVHDDSCALCYHYLNNPPERVRINKSACIACPLYKTLGNIECDDGNNSPYNLLVSTHDPEPMIAALEKTLQTALQERRTNNESSNRTNA